MKKQKNNIRMKIRSSSIFLKITVLFEAVLILSLVFVVLFVTLQFSKTLKDKEIALGDTKIEKLSNYMLERYNRIYSLSNYMNRGEISEIFRKIENDESEAYEYRNINAINVFFAGVESSDNAIVDVILLSITGAVFSRTAKASYEVKPSYPFWEDERIQEFIASEENMEIFYDDPTDYSLRAREPVVSFVGKIYDASLYPHKRAVGIYIINISINDIDQGLELEKGNSKGELSLISAGGQILFSTAKEKLGKQFEESYGEMKEDVYRKTQKIGTSGMTIDYQLPNDILLYDINQIKYNTALVLLVSIGITLLISYVIYYIFNKKVRILLESMEKVQEGDFMLRLPFNSGDEIGLLSQSFNEMCERLNNYIAQVYRAEIQRKNAEINALQMQINPHFLYNTLESIKAKAIEEGDEVTPEMIVLLGKLFRWSMKTNEKIVILEEEIEYVRTYLELQSYRFNKKLDIDIQIPEEYLDFGVPKLILQPLVENVIKHALVLTGKKGIVGITAKQKAGKLEITIFDNGQGMSEEHLMSIRERLENAESQDEFDSIGIQNIHQRLKLLFGQEYGIQIQSILHYGTAVKVTTPAMSIEEMNAIV